MKTGPTRTIILLFLQAALFLSISAEPLFAAENAHTVDWLQPTGGPYPQIKKGESLWIRVSLGTQRLFIMNGDRSIYTMIVSTGLDSPADNRTPLGTFFIQPERGLSFYSAKLGEGARYWVSWLHHGEYLFHSIPTDRKGSIIASEARKLGTKASHGCIRLALPDARWIYRNVQVGTRVVIAP